MLKILAHHIPVAEEVSCNPHITPVIPALEPMRDAKTFDQGVRISNILAAP